MQIVVETRSYLRAANDAGVARDELDAIVSLIASNPEQGDRIAGTGGFRKLRVQRRGSGK